MLSKKNSQADLENKRSIFFLLGTSITLLALIFAFQYKSESDLIIKTAEKSQELEIVTIFPPITHQNPSKPKLKTKINPEIFFEVDFLPDDHEPSEEISLELSGLDKLEPDTEIVEIDIEYTDEPEIVDIYGADKIALPIPCSKMSDKGERIKCLNDWMAQEIGKNIKYPKSEIRIRNQGMVFISFEVSEKGHFSNVSVEKGVSPALDAEAKRVISEIPQISPAIKNGRPAKMKMTIPVSFKLN